MRNIKRKEVCLVLLISLFFCFFQIGFVKSDTNTSVEVDNSPPILSSPIPNQYWPANSSLLDAFNLNDYFFDPNGDDLTFTTSNLENISAIISQNGTVSFFPDIGFIGLKNIIFYCSDGVGNHTTPSNTVILNVGQDSEPPKWYSPEKNRVTVYQNSIINFTTIWTDNIGLSKYYFSIDQGTGWVNYAEMPMHGLYNTSIQAGIQISAPGGTNVSWKFIAYDLMDNFNTTAVQSFLVNSPNVSAEPQTSTGGTGGTDTAGLGDTNSAKQPEEIVKDFSLSFSYAIITLSSGEGTTKLLKITNIGTKNLSFYIHEQNLKKFITISETNFTLAPGQTKDITLDFNFPENFPVEQYFGFIVIDSSAGIKKIPIILNLKQKNSDWDIKINISDKYKVVKPGKPVLANLSFFYIGEEANKSIILFYAIKDVFGNILESGEDNLSTDIAGLEKSLVVPANIPLGEYIFYARISDKSKLAIDSTTFEVGSRFKLDSFLRYGSIFLTISIVSLIILILFQAYNKKRERARILRLYLLLTELKSLVKEGKYDDAINLYLQIKNEYHEIVPKQVLADKDTLKAEIKNISEYLNKKEVVIPKEVPKVEDKKEISKPETEKKDAKSEEKKDAK